MDFKTELEFVKAYIKKEYQDRLFFELQSKKHRQKAISRFSHGADEILNDHFCRLTSSELQACYCKYDIIQGECYIISDNEHDGKTLPLCDAVKYCINSYTAMVLISKKLVLVKEEVEGTPTFYLSK